MIVVHEVQAVPEPATPLDQNRLAELICLATIPGTRDLVDPETVTAEQMLAVMVQWRDRCGCDASRLDAWVTTHGPDAVLAERMRRCRAAAQRLGPVGWVL